MATAKPFLTGKRAAALRRVKRTILKHPQLLDMETWVNGKIRGCGTVACIAGHLALDQGWRVRMRRDDAGYVSVEVVPRSLPAPLRDRMFSRALSEASTLFLGVDHECADRLYFVGYWPTRFRERYRDAVVNDDRARVTADRIEHFIQTGE